VAKIERQQRGQKLNSKRERERNMPFIEIEIGSLSSTSFLPYKNKFYIALFLSATPLTSFFCYNAVRPVQ
jgi:hypothetical protein